MKTIKIKNYMYLTSKNGHFGAVIYSLSDVIKYHNEGFIVQNYIKKLNLK